mmetsp:Transcript_46491/g.149352  ORF Transcript_46491/g.149352 Transcript_46491/m.149352 type:complete len:142 (-) Transcript_46491:117-542(-)
MKPRTASPQALRSRAHSGSSDSSDSPVSGGPIMSGACLPTDGSASRDTVPPIVPMPAGPRTQTSITKPINRGKHYLCADGTRFDWQKPAEVQQRHAQPTYRPLGSGSRSSTRRSSSSSSSSTVVQRTTRQPSKLTKLILDL